MPLGRELETEQWAQEGMAGEEADRKPRQLLQKFLWDAEQLNRTERGNREAMGGLTFFFKILKQ